MGHINSKSFKDKLLVGFFYIITGIFALFCMIPLWIALVSSVTNETTLLREGYRLLPADFTLRAYEIIFTNSITIYRAYGVTLLTTAAGTLLTIILTGSYAYPLTVKTFRYRRGLSLFAYATMLFNGGLVPTYILYSKYFHLSDNILVLIIPGALSAYNMFLMKNYFSTIPDSLAESAKIDGASDIYIFKKIIIPLSKPILATIGLFAAMGYWNQWFNVVMYIDNEKLYTLQFLIMRIQRQVDFLTSSLGAQALKGGAGQSLPTIGIRLATAMVSIGPIILLYPLLQKYFIKGLIIGAVKE